MVLHTRKGDEYLGFQNIHPLYCCSFIIEVVLILVLATVVNFFLDIISQFPDQASRVIVHNFTGQLCFFDDFCYSSVYIINEIMRLFSYRQ